MNPHVPELCQIHKQKKVKCIIDGELIVLNNKVPDFELIKNRSLTQNKYKIKRMSTEFPATFTAFDILYYKDSDVTALPLLKRKALLDKAIAENERLAISRYILAKGKELFNFTKEKKLEGIVAKRGDSIYKPGVRTRDWIKCKNLQDEDFFICGYIENNDSGTASIILGRAKGDKLSYAGRVSLGLSRREFDKIKQVSQAKPCINKRHDNAVYIEPLLKCCVKFMEKTDKGGLRQPIFKQLLD